MSTSKVINLRPARWFAVVMALVVLALPAGAYAQKHRARLSKEVTEQLKGSANKQIQVWVELPKSVLDRLSQQYGIKVQQVIDGAGAVLDATTDQINRMADDDQVDEISFNHKVY